MKTEEKDSCILCGFDGDSNSCHIRHSYLTRDSKLYRGYYRPHLTIDEVWKIKSRNGEGDFKICSNRTLCRKRLHQQMMETINQ